MEQLSQEESGKNLQCMKNMGKKKKEERNKKQFCQHFCWQIVSAGI